MKLRLASSLLALGAAWPSPAQAHEVGLSYGVYRADAAGLSATLTFAEKELLLVADGLDRDRDGKASEAEVKTASAALARDVLAFVEVRAGETVCPLVFASAQRVEGDGVSVEARADCAAGPAGYAITMNILERTTPGHRHLVRVERDGTPAVDLVTHRADRSFVVGAAAQPAHSSGFGGMFVSGIEHILSGLDHLLFLLGLVLVGGRWRALVGVITSFTVAHSITLGLAVLHIWAPSGHIVEPLIALSVAYVGIENWFIKEGAKRWRVTFAFGLVHGFGFAGALGEIRLPPAEVPKMLLAFNLGVESGQLAVLAVVLPLLFVLRKQAWFRDWGVRAVSAVVAVFGLYWFVTRLIAG